MLHSIAGEQDSGRAPRPRAGGPTLVPDSLKVIIRSFTRSLASRSFLLPLLNWYYNRLDFEGKHRFWSRYAKIFRGSRKSVAVSDWCVDFLDHSIRLPLRAESSWLDWDTALAILGHDVEVKSTYAALIQSEHRPSVFIDIGANYGTHSLLFLSQGIASILFEPNPACFQHFEAACRLNGFQGRWESVALGSAAGDVALTYPERDTWNGSVSPDVAANLGNTISVKSIRVPIQTLDRYCNDIPRGKWLLKIDVEGFECEVLKGASRVLGERAPKIIFESNDAGRRDELHAILRNFDYRIHQLPWSPATNSGALSATQFALLSDTNFIAIPGDKRTGL